MQAYGCKQSTIDFYLIFSLTSHANIVYYGTDSQLKAIEELKDKVKSGAKLETAQYKEIETTGEIRKSWRSV